MVRLSGPWLRTPGRRRARGYHVELWGRELSQPGNRALAEAAGIDGCCRGALARLLHIHLPYERSRKLRALLPQSVWFVSTLIFVISIPLSTSLFEHPFPILN